MRHVRVAFHLAGLLAVLLAGVRPSAQTPGVTAQLDRYLRGDFATVVAQLTEVKDFGVFLEELQTQAPAWIDAGGTDQRARRELAAATLALEAARAAEHEEWKVVQRINLGMVELERPGGSIFVPHPFKNADLIRWKPPTLLIEWGCAVMRQRETPPPIERIWHLAALSVAQRRGDYEFLIGSPWIERGNAEDEIDHLDHSAKRFPRESRFALAGGIAVEWYTWEVRSSRQAPPHRLPQAERMFQGMLTDEAIGAEASLRLGVTQLRAGKLNDAIKSLDRVDAMTREPFVVYLARYFKGQALERSKRLDEAERAYEGALAAVPHAQSASVALSALRFAQNRRVEAAELIEASLSASEPVDPWRAYPAADDRFWPQLIAQLRAEIAR